MSFSEPAPLPPIGKPQQRGWETPIKKAPGTEANLKTGSDSAEEPGVTED